MHKRFLVRIGLLALIMAALFWRERDRLAELGWLGAAPPPAEAPSTAAITPPPAAPAPALPELPQKEIAALPQHKVPEEDVGEPVLPLDMRNKMAAEHGAQSGAGQSAAARPPGPPLLPVKQLSGNGQVAGATALSLAGRRLSLFGVRPPEGGDRCPAEPSANGATSIPGTSEPSPQPCVETARGTLVTHLQGTVSCRFPMPAAGPTGAAICLDAQGNDLGGLLVSEGLALADRSQSFDYVGAEQIARSQRRGLWSFR